MHLSILHNLFHRLLPQCSTVKDIYSIMSSMYHENRLSAVPCTPAQERGTGLRHFLMLHWQEAGKALEDNLCQPTQPAQSTGRACPCRPNSRPFNDFQTHLCPGPCAALPLQRTPTATFWDAGPRSSRHIWCACSHTGTAAFCLMQNRCAGLSGRARKALTQSQRQCLVRPI